MAEPVNAMVIIVKTNAIKYRFIAASLLGDDFSNRSRGFHRAGTELTDRRPDEPHRRQRDPRNRFARHVNVLTGLVPAAGPPRKEHRDVLDGVDFGIASIAERHNQAVIEYGSFALLDRVQFDQE